MIATIALSLLTAPGSAFQAAARPIQYTLLTNEVREKQPRFTVTPKSEAELVKLYPSETYHAEKADSGRFVVIDRRLWQIEQEQDALDFLTFMLKRPDPFAPVQLGSLERALRDAVTRLMYIKGTEREWAQGQRAEDIGIALGMDMIVRLVGNERSGSALLGARLNTETKARYDRQLADWAVRFKETADGVAPMEEPAEPMGQIKCLFFCDVPYQTAAMEEAAKVLRRYVEDLQRKTSLAIEGNQDVLARMFSEQLAGLPLPASTNFDAWPEPLRDAVLRGLRASWRSNGFSSPQDVDAFLPTVQSVKLMLSFNVAYCVKRGERSPARTALEVFRSG